MTVAELLAVVEEKLPPVPPEQLAAFEADLDEPLPDDYRRFLIACNGGHLGGRYMINVIGGFRKEPEFSLESNRDAYDGRIPDALVWIMNDPFGNAICLGITGEHRGRVYFWNHEEEPDPDTWDGEVETADNVRLLADSFTEFVAGLA